MTTNTFQLTVAENPLCYSRIRWAGRFAPTHHCGFRNVKARPSPGFPADIQTHRISKTWKIGVRKIEGFPRKKSAIERCGGRRKVNAVGPGSCPELRESGPIDTDKQTHSRRTSQCVSESQKNWFYYWIALFKNRIPYLVPDFPRCRMAHQPGLAKLQGGGK